MFKSVLEVETCVYHNHKQSWQTQICSDNHSNAVFTIFMLIFNHLWCVLNNTVPVQRGEFKIYDIWFITHIVYFIICKVGLNNEIRSGSVSESYIKTEYCIKYRVDWGTIMFPWCCKRGDGETDGQSDRQMEETGSLNILLLECCVNYLTIKCSMHNVDGSVLYCIYTPLLFFSWKYVNKDKH